MSLFIQPSKLLSDKGKLSGDNWNRNNFRMYLFLRAKKIVFCEYLFLRMASFWKFRVYKFHPQRKKNKKKTVESWDMRLMFLWRETEKQEGHDERLLLLMILKKTELTNIFFEHIFLYLFSGNMNFLHI